MRSPMLITLRVVNVGNNEGSIEDFVGSSDRTFTDHKVHALYNYNIIPYDRDKSGYSNDISGEVFVSPLELQRVIGTFRVDRKKTHVIFTDQEVALKEIEYMEPLFNSCVAIKLIMDDLTRG